MINIMPSLCTESQICMAICSWEHFGETTTKRSRITVDADWPQTPNILVCLACKQHECVEACPHDALIWDNWIVLDKDRCDSCGICIGAWKAGNYEIARELQFSILLVVRAMFALPFPLGFKYALELRGFNMGPPKQPLSDAERFKYTTMKARIEKIMVPILEGLNGVSEERSPVVS